MRRFLHSLLLIIFAILLFGCSKSNSLKNKRIKITIPKYPLTFNPQLSTDILSSSILFPLYNSLFTYDKKGGIKTDIVKEYEWTDDKTFSFKIKKGLKFSNGEFITEQTIIENLKYFADTKRNFPYSSQFDFIEKIEYKEGKINICLKYPFAPLLSYLTFKIVPENFLGKDTIIPSSTGFKVINLKKHSFLYESAEKEFEFSICPDEITGLLKLIKGEADILYGYKLKDTVFKKYKIKAKDYILNSLYYLVFNLRSKKFKKYEYRFYINRIIDFNKFYKILNNHYNYSFFPIINPDYKIDDKFKLKEAELKQKINSIELLVNSESELRKKYAEIIRYELIKHNIRVNINAVEYGVYLKRLKTGNFEIALGAYVFDYDPDQRDIWKTNGLMNYSGFHNKKIDFLLEEGVKITDYQKRRRLYKIIYKTIMKKLPIIFLPSPLYSVYYKENIKIKIPLLVHSNFSVLSYLKDWRKY